MKNYLLLKICFFASLNCYSQQILPYSIPHKETGIKSLLDDTSKSISSSDDKVFIYGVGSADALDFSQFSAAGAINAGFRFSPNTYLAASVNVGAKLESRQVDSISINELYFPDVANSAAAGSFEWDILNSCKDYKLKTHLAREHGFSFGIESSLQNRSIVKDSVDYKLGIFNWNTGLKYRWNYTSSKGINASFMCGAMFNYILITDKSHDNFNLIFNDASVPADSKIKSNFNGFSTVISFQINDSIFYVRTYTDFARMRDLAFSVGIKQALKFRSF